MRRKSSGRTSSAKAAQRWAYTGIRMSEDQAKRKKRWERIFLDSFLGVIGWAGPIGIIEGEAPDFVLTRPDGSIVGVEVTQVFADGGRGGSQMREDESARNRWLNSLAELYYDLGGLPVNLKVRIERPVDGDLLCAVVAVRVLRAAERMAPLDSTWLYFRDERDRPIASVWVHRVPDLASRYSRGWTDLGTKIGLVRRATPEQLQRVIVNKAKKLGDYQRQARNVALLMVAYQPNTSGKLRFDATSKLDAAGFQAVYLHHYPGSNVIKLC